MIGGSSAISDRRIQSSQLTPSDIYWPRQLAERLKAGAPVRLWAIGAPEILSTRKVGLFCSVPCPGNVILGACHAARKLRDEGVTVISGFHSPVEKECLRILLQGNQPIVICLIRALGSKTRIPPEWQKALDSERLLLLSSIEKPRRPDKEDARRRNELVAALSDEVLIIHATAGGRVEKLSRLLDRWGVVRRRPGPATAFGAAE